MVHIIYGKGVKLNCNFNFNGKQLEQVNEYKYLGVIVNSIQSVTGNIFRNMIKYTTEKAHKACFGVTRKCNSVGPLTPDIGFYLFDTYVMPVLNFGSELWFNVKETQKLESVQLGFLKYLDRKSVV